MRKQNSVFLVVALLASVAFGQESQYDLREAGGFEGNIGEGTPMVCDDIEMMVLGSIDGQTSASGTWLDPLFLGAEVVDAGGDQKLEYNNVIGNDTFGDIMEVTYDASLIAVADDGFTLSMEYDITDLNCQFFFTPIAAVEGFIFTRLGDPDLDGDWDVLETDGLGTGIFFDTGVAIANTGTIEFDILDLDMDISIDGTVIYTGGIIGSNGDAGITPGETLTTIDIESTNNLGGLNSVLTVDNIALNTSCSGGCTNPLGDVNGDGVLDLLDVTPFVNAITSGTFICEADVNEDGVVDLLDVTPFVALLTGG